MFDSLKSDVVTGSKRSSSMRSSSMSSSSSRVKVFLLVFVFILVTVISSQAGRAGRCRVRHIVIDIPTHSLLLLLLPSLARSISRCMSMSIPRHKTRSRFINRYRSRMMEEERRSTPGIVECIQEEKLVNCMHFGLKVGREQGEEGEGEISEGEIGIGAVVMVEMVGIVIGG